MADPLVTAIEQANQRCLSQRPQAPLEPCESDAAALLTCEPPRGTPDPETVLVFRKPVPLKRVDFRLPPHDDVGSPQHVPTGLSIGCLPLFKGQLSAALAVDLIYEQRWCFKRHVVSALATTIALAPGETLNVTLKQSQRKVFDRTTLEQVEQTETTESTTVDRSVVNVTRSSSKTNNWSVSGDASISLPIKKVDIGLNVGGNLSQSVTETSQSSAEQVSEATRKSADSLRALSKVEVKETMETTQETTHSRLITNPYRDRSLRLNVFALAKEYLVEFALTGLRPVVLLEVSDIQFDRQFVLSNGDFLQGNLLDTGLRFELSDALEKAADHSPEPASEQVQSLSELALRYLFEEPNIFKVDAVKAGPASVGDGNDPTLAYEANRPQSGLDDAIANQFGRLFTILNFYFRVYKDKVQANKALAVPLALSLEASLGPLWSGVEEGDTVGHVLDESHFTEPFRRLAGFLSLVSGSIRPLLLAAEGEKERRDAARRAEFVVGRVVEHLRCHKDYYIARYLFYLSRLTGGLTIRRFAEDALSRASTPDGLQDKWTALFATEEAFVDGNTVVVPGRCTYGKDLGSTFMTSLGQPASRGLTFGVLRADRVLTPADGSHIEPASGSCVLPDVPPSPPPPALRVVVEQGPGR